MVGVGDDLTEGLHGVLARYGLALASTGVDVDVGPGEGRVALRADLDALPMEDEKGVPYRSKVAGMCHACGHDVHTAMLLGAGLFLAERAASGQLAGGVRLIFQP